MIAWLIVIAAIAADPVFHARHIVSIGLAVAATAAVAAHLRAAPVGTLRWDREVWWWKPANPHLENAPISVRSESFRLLMPPTVHLDLGVLLLLRGQASGGAPAWWWATRSGGPATWRPFRRAVYSRRAAAPAAGQSAIGGPGILS